jgi:hypothetical protein
MGSSLPVFASRDLFKKAKVVFKIHAPRDDSSIASRLDL